ncbi:MAG: toll/interleukin-1 receptor domain-containing protein [Anaerolineales bacterium]|nr:toll/interleukin-1 receptor domain-containing protein [Anaerolineales bacterium]
MAKIFISYKRNVSPDTPVATAVFETLRKQHEVFMDVTLQVGEKWADRIHNAIKESDYLIIFLSENSIHSEGDSDRNAHHQGGPAIWGITSLWYIPLGLNPLQWALWDSDADTPRLITELERAVSGVSLQISFSDLVGSF